MRADRLPSFYSPGSVWRLMGLARFVPTQKMSLKTRLTVTIDPA
jgi:hypothetical protein